MLAWLREWYGWRKWRPHPQEFYCEGCEDSQGRGHSDWLYHREAYEAARWRWLQRRPVRKNGRGGTGGRASHLRASKAGSVGRGGRSRQGRR